MNITEHTTMRDICNAKEYSPVNEYFFSNMTDDVLANTLSHYGIDKCGFVPTLSRIEKLLSVGVEMVYGVYDENEIAESTDKESVKLVYFPSEKNLKKEKTRYAVICPGGAYVRQWGIIEGMAVAERLNRMGYAAFVLYYRTAQKPLLPKPLDDLAAAVKYIENRSENFCVKKGEYVVGGFSAGGHLVCDWGTVNVGFSVYGCPKPQIIFAGYPANSVYVFWQNAQKNGRTPESDKFLGAFGKLPLSEDDAKKYSVELNMDKNYPPTYLVACEDDPLVPIVSSELFIKKLSELGIAHKAEIVKTGGHSFGVGNGTLLDGWIERAVKFWESL